MLKTCMQCQQTKPLPSFAESKLQPDGYCRWCKDCQKQYGLSKYDKKKLKKKKKTLIRKRQADNYTANDNKGCIRCGFLFAPTLKNFGLDMSRKDHLSAKCKKCIGIIRRKKASKNKTYVQRHCKAYNEVGKLLPK